MMFVSVNVSGGVCGARGPTGGGPSPPGGRARLRGGSHRLSWRQHRQRLGGVAGPWNFAEAVLGGSPPQYIKQTLRFGQSRVSLRRGHAGTEPIFAREMHARAACSAVLRVPTAVIIGAASARRRNVFDRFVTQNPR